MPPTASSMPVGTTILGPILGTSQLVESCAITISAATIGRKATPFFTGE